jgi:molybdenum cofactor cytidylyltransferase
VTADPAPIAAVLLAAGASSRMGTPKALLRFEGRTFLERLGAVFAARCTPVVAVVGDHADVIAEALGQSGGVALVRNPDPTRGQLSSLQCGLRALPPGLGGVCFHPVDAPALRAETVARLIDALHSAPSATELVIPRHQGRRGHPVLLRASLIGDFLALPPEESARRLIHERVARTLYVGVDDAGVLGDIDTPEEYRRFVEGGVA